MRAWLGKRFVVLGLLAAFTLAAWKYVAPVVLFLCRVCLVLASALLPCRHPSDASMRHNFYAHEADFNQLVVMSQQDADIDVITPDDIIPSVRLLIPNDDALTTQRWDEYRKLFRKLGLSGGVHRDPNQPGTVAFSASGKQCAAWDKATIKGYVYSAVPLSPVVASLDDGPPPEVNRDPNDVRLVYEAIKPNWYLFWWEGWDLD